METAIIASFLPHGYCMQWQPGLIGTHMAADAAIALAYFSIPSLLFSFIRKRRDIKFNWIFIAFALFILACGMTHVMDIVTLWVPAYRLAAFFKVVTAVVSVITAGALFRLMPGILKIPTPNQHQAVKDAEAAMLKAKDELQAVLDRFQGTFESAAIGLSHISPDGRFLMVNRQLCRMLGYTREELLAMNAQDISHPDDLDLSQELGQQLLNGESESYSFQKRYVKKRSMTIWVELTVSLVRADDGKPNYFVVATKDITEQKRSAVILEQTLEQLKRREKQLALLFEEGGVGDFTWDIARDAVSAHPIVWGLYGHPEERGPRPSEWFMERQHPEDIPAIRSHVEKVLATPTLKLDLEFRIVRPDSSIRWVACRGSVLRDKSGKPAEIYGLNIDISNLKRAQDDARESERRLLALTDVMPQLAWFTSPIGNVEFFNQQWYKYTGQVEGDALNWGWQPAIHPADVENLLTRWKHALKTGTDHEAEFRLKAKDGTYRWFLGRGRPLRAADGNIIRWFGTCTDIEERKASEARLLSFSQEMERRVAERTQDLQLANSELARKNEEVEAFVYIVSHDLRTPLVNLQGFSKELEQSCEELRESFLPALSASPEKERLESILTEDIPGSLRYITASTTKFERLIEALLELSRCGRHVYRSEELDLVALAHATLDSMRRSIATSGAQVSVAPMPKAQGDPTALGQVLSNLIGNSVKYLQPGRPGRIEIGGVLEQSTAQQPTAHYWVRDNGAGLPSSAKPRLFQVFQRFHPQLAPGDGIGLAMVKKIVERHGGKIWAEGEEGVGTTFHFTLPGS
jgi:PAS domain S-box-containing protein